MPERIDSHLCGIEPGGQHGTRERDGMVTLVPTGPALFGQQRRVGGAAAACGLQLRRKACGNRNGATLDLPAAALARRRHGEPWRRAVIL